MRHLHEEQRIEIAWGQMKANVVRSIGSAMTPWAIMIAQRTTSAVSIATDILTNMAFKQNKNEMICKDFEGFLILLECCYISAVGAWINWCRPFIAVNLYLVVGTKNRNEINRNLFTQIHIRHILGHGYTHSRRRDSKTRNRFVCETLAGLLWKFKKQRKKQSVNVYDKVVQRFRMERATDRWRERERSSHKINMEIETHFFSTKNARIFFYMNIEYMLYGWQLFAYLWCICIMRVSVWSSHVHTTYSILFKYSYCYREILSSNYYFLWSPSLPLTFLAFESFEKYRISLLLCDRFVIIHERWYRCLLLQSIKLP